MHKEASARSAIVVAALLYCNSPATAMNWSFTKGVGLTSTYSDNITFTTEDLAESGFIDRLSPVFGLSGVGNRTNLSLQAGGVYEGVFISDVREESSFVPRVDGSVNTVVVPNLFFARAAVSVREFSTTSESVFDDPLVVEEDETIQTSYSFNPYLDYTLNNTDQFRLSYNFSEIRTDNDLVTDSQSQQAQFDWRHLTPSGVWGWGFNSDYQRADSAESDLSAELYSATLNASYLITSEWLLSAGVGSEWVEQSTEEPRTRTNTWSVQLGWRPSQRSNLEFGYSESSVGKAPFFSYTLSGRRSTVQVSWRRRYARILTSAGLSLEDELLNSLGLLDPVTQQGGASADQNLDQLLFDGDFSIDETLSFDFTLRGRLSTLSLNTAYLVRENQADGTETESLQMGASFGRSLNSFSDFDISYQYREQLPDESSEVLYENRLILTFNISF